MFLGLILLLQRFLGDNDMAEEEKRGKKVKSWTVSALESQTYSFMYRCIFLSATSLHAPAQISAASSVDRPSIRVKGAIM